MVVLLMSWISFPLLLFWCVRSGEREERGVFVFREKFFEVVKSTYDVLSMSSAQVDGGKKSAQDDASFSVSLASNGALSSKINARSCPPSDHALKGAPKDGREPAIACRKMPRRENQIHQLLAQCCVPSRVAARPELRTLLTLRAWIR